MHFVAENKSMAALSLTADTYRPGNKIKWRYIKVAEEPHSTQFNVNAVCPGLMNL